MGFTTALDVANRALQHCGTRRIASFSDPTSQATELAFCYDKLRDAEIRRNQWRFATRRVILRPVDVSTLLWTPPVFSAGSSYAAGAVVNYTPTGAVGSYLWEVEAATSATTTPDVSTLWHRYFGPLAVDLWILQSTVISPSAPQAPQQPLPSSYYSGEIVIVPTTWAIGTTYPINQVVNYNGTFYVSLVGSNVGNEPDVTPADWAQYVGTGSSTYARTSTQTPLPLVYGAGATFYRSLISNNFDNPTSATGTWLLLGGTTEPLTILYPIGAGPQYDTTTKNVYRLPNGYLRQAAENPKEGIDPYLGAPGAPFELDWVFEGDYIVSRYNGPIMLRFVADVIDVYDMDPMFCEGLAARIATEIAPSTVDPEKLSITLANVRAHYKGEMRSARLANCLEIGFDTPPRDEWLAVRF